MFKSIAFSLAIAFTAIAVGQRKPVVLKGLDPVLLVQGKYVQGKESLAKEFGKFRYLFANAQDQAVFTANPQRYAVWNSGACLMMPDMDGDPNLFLVVDGTIYLAGNDTCFAAVKADPYAYIKQKPAESSVAIMLFPGVDIIDYSGPWEVFGQAGYKVFTVAAKPGPLKTAMGQTVTPDYTFENCPKPDVLLLPGGAVSILEKGDPVAKWIVKMANDVPYTMSVCNGAYWLAATGLLDGKSATTIHSEVDNLAKAYPNVHVVTDQRLVDNGKIITTAGLSAGIDGAFHVLEKMKGGAEARSIALGMEYNWQPKFHYARADFADKYLRRAGHVSLPSDAVPSDETSEGDMNRWEEDWVVTCTKSGAPEIMAAIVKCLTGAKWNQVSVSPDSLESHWTFTGDDGSSWTAVYALKPDPQKAGRFLGKSVLEKVG